MAMKKTISKALAMAVMMSVLAGGQAYAEVIIKGEMDESKATSDYNSQSEIQVKYQFNSVTKTATLTSTGLFFNNNGQTITLSGLGLTLANDNSLGIHNIKDGVEANDAVNFSQIKAVDGNYVKEANTVAQNFTALDTQVKTNVDDIATLKTDKADKANTLAGYGITDAYTKSETDTELAKKADKATTLAGYGITDAYTATQTDNAISSAIAGKADKSYVETELSKKADKTALDTETQERKDADADLQKQIDAISGGASSEALEKLDNKINQTNDRVDRVGATAAALAGIHYQPMAKGQSQVAIGMGGYKGKKATALGLAYQISDRISGSVAGAANGSEHMFNVGFNYLFGQHSEKDVAQMAAPGSMSLKEAELQAQVDSQSQTIKAMFETMTKMQARIDALEKK